MASCLQIVDQKYVERHANFVVLIPESLPTDCILIADQGIFRPEMPPKPISDHPNGDCWSNWAASHTCSWSFQIEGKNRKIRCKQFLYDLGPLSSLDHAALYDHRPDLMKSFAIDADRIGWMGIDYNQKPTACMLAWGTNIEFRVVEGDFTETELIKMLKSCNPINTEILEKPMAQLSYWSRYPRYDLNMCSMLYHPPSTFWKLRWPWAPVDHQWKIEPAMKKEVFDYAGKKWVYDSTCEFPGYETQHLFFPNDGHRHQQLWIRTFPEEQSPLKKPTADQNPATEIFSGKTTFPVQRISNSENPIFVISENEQIGPHDAVFWKNQIMHLIHVSNAQSHHANDFKSLVMAYAKKC